MKILVLSCGTGQGHNSAAAAVREAFLRHGHDCVIADPLQFGRKRTAGVVAATYNGSSKMRRGRSVRSIRRAICTVQRG